MSFQNVTQNINIIPNNPELKDLLDFFGKDLKLNFNCHHIGNIQVFNSTNQTAQVTINYTKTFLQIDDSGNTSITTQNYPMLISCPVICLGGGTGSLTFPILPGDECLVLFNDRDLDNWFSGSSSAAPASTRLHSFADAIVLVGLRSLPKVLVNYDTNAVTLQNGVNSVKVYDNEALITVANNTISLQSDKAIVNLSTGVSLELDATGKLKITNLTGEFVSSLVQLFNDVQTGTVTTMLGPEPLVMPTFTTDLAVLQSFKA